MRLLVISAVLSFSALLLAAGGVNANESTDLDPIRSQQLEINANVRAERGVYANLSPTQRQKMLSTQERVLGVIDGKQSSDQLSEPARIQLFNDLEAIEAIANQAEGERLVCERVATIGTNRKERVCKTVAQRREEMRMAQEALRTRGNCRDCP